MLEKWEKKYGLKLPERLVAEFNSKNGGTLAINRFKVGEEIINIHEIFGISPDDQYSCMAPLSNWHSWEEEGLNLKDHGDPKKLVLLYGDGHFYYCLDYNGTPAGKPKISYVDIECSSKKAAVCSSFDELIASAYSGDEKPRIEYGAGWKGYTILVKDTVPVEGRFISNTLGTKGGKVRLQTEIRDEDKQELGEMTWRLKSLEVVLGVSEENQLELNIKSVGDGSSAILEDGRWINERFCWRTTIHSKSADKLEKAFRFLVASKKG